MIKERHSLGVALGLTAIGIVVIGGAVSWWRGGRDHVTSSVWTRARESFTGVFASS
jgi:hypothetical protein